MRHVYLSMIRVSLRCWGRGWCPYCCPCCLAHEAGSWNSCLRMLEASRVLSDRREAAWQLARAWQISANMKEKSKPKTRNGSEPFLKLVGSFANLRNETGVWKPYRTVIIFKFRVSETVSNLHCSFAEFRLTEQALITILIAAVSGTFFEWAKIYGQNLWAMDVP